MTYQLDPSLVQQNAQMSSPTGQTGNGYQLDPSLIPKQMGAVEAGLTTFNQAVGSLPQGTIKLAAQGINKLTGTQIANPVINSIDQQAAQGAAESEQAYQQHPTAAGVGEGIGTISNAIYSASAMAAIPAVGLSSKVPFVQKLVTSGLKSGIEGGITAGAQYSKDSNNLQNALMGAGSAVVANGSIKGVSLIPQAAGKVLDYVPAIAGKVNAALAPAQSLIDKLAGTVAGAASPLVGTAVGRSQN